jgi:hypothetical protein
VLSLRGSVSPYQAHIQGQTLYGHSGEQLHELSDASAGRLPVMMFPHNNGRYQRSLIALDRFRIHFIDFDKGVQFLFQGAIGLHDEPLSGSFAFSKEDQFPLGLEY